MAAPAVTDHASTRDEVVARQRVGVADVAAVTVAALATLALVVPTYARRPFWFDELVSLEVAKSSWSAFGEYVATIEANMALYHAVLRAWVWIAEGEAGVRALSVAFALATLPLVYALARRLYDRSAAIIAVLLLSVNVSFVGYSRDARSYALTLLLVTTSSYALVRALDSGRRRDWVVYGVTAGLAVWAHLLASLVVFAHFAWLALERRQRALPGFAIAASVLAALLLPLGLAVVLAGQHPQLEWLPRPGPQKLPGLFLWFVESRWTVVVYFAGGAAALVYAFLDWRRGSTSWPRRESFLLLWLLVPPAAAFLASYVTPLYLYRYFLVCLPALVLLVAAGFARLRPVWLGIGLTVAALGLSLGTVESCQPDCKIRHDGWNEAGAYLAARTMPGDAMVIYPASVRTGVDAYLPRDRPRLLYPAHWELTDGASVGDDDLSRAMANVSRYERVWLVTWWLPAESAREGLASKGRRVSAREFPGNVRVELYEPRAASQ
jgi:mannosyltransferase